MKFSIILILLFFTKNVYSLTINDSVKSTIENNNKVKIAYEKLNETKETIENAIGRKLPTITGTISGTYSNSDTKTVIGDTTPETLTDSYKLSATQNLYDGGFKDLEIERSKLIYENEIINFYNTVQDLSLSAIDGYFTVINYEKSLEANKKNYDSVTRFLEETKLKYNLGSATITDVMNAETAFAIAETNVFSAEQNYNLSLKTFKSIVRKEAINLEDFVDLGENLNFDNVLSNVLKNNYSLLISKNNIKIKNIELAKEKSSNKASIDLTASTEYSDSSRIDNGTENLNATIGLTVTIPIFQQNLDKSNIRKINSQILQEEIFNSDLKDNLEIEVSNFYKDYVVSISNLKTSKTRIKYANILLTTTIEEYNLGTKSITDLIDAEGQLLDANVEYFNANKNYLLNYFNLLALDGSLIKLFEEYLPKLN